MTYDLICDCKFRGNLRRKRVALVLNVRTDGQNFSSQKCNYFKVVQKIDAKILLLGVRKIYLLLHKRYTNCSTYTIFTNYVLINSTRFSGSNIYSNHVPNRNLVLFDSFISFV